MNMQNIPGIANERGISPGNSGRIELVRALQREENNFVKLIYINKYVSLS